MCANETKTTTTETALTQTEQSLPTTPNLVNNIFGDVQQFENAQRMARLLAASDYVPEQYKGKPANCVIAIDIANRMGISPLTIMQNLFVVRGKPSWSGQACRALIENSGKYTDVEPVYIGQEGQPSWGCFLQATSRTTGNVVKGPKVTIEMARNEGWVTKSGSKWQTMPELMLAYRAAAFFARVHCPSALMGFQTAEEVRDLEAEKVYRDLTDVTKESPKAVNIDDL